MGLFSLNTALSPTIKPLTIQPAQSTSYSIPQYTQTAQPSSALQNISTVSPTRANISSLSSFYTPQQQASPYQMNYQPTSAITPTQSFYKPVEPVPQFVNPYSQQQTTQPTTQVNPAQPKPATQAPTSSSAPKGWDPNAPMMQPGTYENWYAQNAARYSQPSTLSQYYNQVSGRLMGQNYQPTTAQSAYSNMAAQMGTGQGAANSQTVSRMLLGPTAGEQYMSQAAQNFSGPNYATNYANMAAPFFSPNNTTASQSFYNTQGQNLTRAGAGESYAQNAGIGDLAYNNILTDPGQLENFYRTNARDFMVPGEAETAARERLLNTRWMGTDFAEQGLNYALGQAQDPTFSSSILNDLRGTLGTSASEDLYNQGPSSLNAYYDLQRKRQTEDLQNQMAAMGVFGSGETVEGMARIREGLGAEQANREADYMAGLAGQADESMLGRAGLLGQLGSSADASEMARLNSILGAYGMASEEDLAGLGLQMQSAGGLLDVGQLGLQRLMAGGELAGAAQQAGMARLGMRGDLLNTQAQLGLQADQLGINRLLAGGQLAGQADAATLEKMLGGGQLASSADASRWNQYQGLANVGAQSADALISRLMGSSSAGLGADAESRARLVELMNAAQGVDALRLQGAQSDLGYLTAGANMAQNVDSNALNWLNSGANAAQNAQTMYENRLNTIGGNLTDLGGRMAGTIKDFSQMTADEQTALKTDGINLLMAQGNLSREQAQQKINEWIQAGTLVAQVAALKSGNKPSTSSTAAPNDPANLVSGYFK